MKLILASGSPYRKTLLKRLGLPFSAESPDIDESPAPGEAAEALALRLAKQKAAAIAARHPAAVVIGSDQVASLHGELLGKPGNFDHALAQLKKSSGNCVRFWTSICVTISDEALYHHCEPFTVHFRELDDREIRRYLELEQPFDCAGSFKWERLGIALFRKLEGDDPTALEGLPLIALCEGLRRVGLDPLNQPGNPC